MSSDFLDKLKARQNQKKDDNLLKRDAHGQLDKDQAKKVNEELLQKFLAESDKLNKDNSFSNVKTQRRDIVVHLAVTILPRVDGHDVIGEKEREMGQWCFQLPAQQLPVKNFTVIKALSELCHLGRQCLLKIGAVRP